MSGTSSSGVDWPALVKTLLDSTGELVFVLNAEGRVEETSAGARELLDDPTAQIRGRPWPDFCRPGEEVKALLQNLSPGQEPVYFRTELLGREGQVHPAVFSLRPFAPGGAGHRGYLVVGYSLERPPGAPGWEGASRLSSRVTGLQESLATVSRRMTETALQLAEEQQKMRAVMASLGEGMLVLDTGQRIVQVGGTAERLLECDRGKLLGQRLAEVLPGLFQSLGRLLAKAGDPFPGDVTELARDVRFAHGERTLRANLAPIVDSERRHLGTVVIFEDFTRIAEVDRMKSELISIVSHELRTPLTSVRGYVDLLLDEEADQETRQEYLKIVRDNTVRLVEMLEVMLDIDRIESGQLQLACEAVDVAYVFHYVRSTFAQAAEEKGIELALDVQPGVAVQGDMDRIIQILCNLVSNAIKYSPEGSRVTLRAEEEAGQVRVDVVDTGIGISLPDQERLFDKFYRTAGSKGVQGTGLGLSIAKSLAKAHGGTLSVTSTPGEGSTFTVVLPKAS